MEQNIDHLLASHAAPTLMGIKPANLISLPNFQNFGQMVLYYNNHFNERQIYFYSVCQCNYKQLLLVYCKPKLIQTLCHPQKRAFLLSSGYPVYNKYNVEFYLDAILTHLAMRMQTKQGFPHEIGIFLGYPLEDVIGFIAHNGSNYKCSGCWKVYGDETLSRRLFAQYRACKQQLTKALQHTNGNLLHCLCTNSYFTEQENINYGEHRNYLLERNRQH